MAVAVSGGRDSLALLHVTSRTARELGLQVAALHVHHGLMPSADGWAAQVQALCEQWAREGLPLRFRMRRLQGAPPTGASVEAWARRGRYTALAEMAHAEGASLVLLAHHLEDQAETVLLQALRGAGPAGLAAMPALRTQGGIVWARPWLGQPRARIEAYVALHGLRHVDDESNLDTRHARNRLRHELMPALRRSFADADAALATVAAQAAQARALIDEVVALRLPRVLDGADLRADAWADESDALRPHLLRAWLRQRCAGQPGVPESLVARLLREWPRAGSARWPAPGGELRCYRGRLSYAARAVAPCAEQERAVAPGLDALPLTVGDHPLAAWGAVLRIEPAASGGIAAHALEHAQWRPRQGGESFQRAPATPARSLKKQFQAAGVAAWQRGAPLLWSAGGQLLFVPALGMDARALAAPGEPQLRLAWLPMPGADGDGASAAA